MEFSCEQNTSNSNLKYNIMSKWYNSTTHEWYTEGQSLTRKIDNGVFSGIPSVEQLESWGFEEYIEPTPTPEELLARAKSAKIAELEAYDSSDEVNSFSVNGVSMWVPADKRAVLRTSIDAYKALGAESITKVWEGQDYTFPVTAWETMLNMVEVYASECFNQTQRHAAAIQALTTVAEVEAYDYTVGYPEKLIF
jgi:hypothetical protein